MSYGYFNQYLIYLMIHIEFAIKYQMHISLGKSGFEWFQACLSFYLNIADQAHHPRFRGTPESLQLREMKLLRIFVSN